MNTKLSVGLIALVCLVAVFNIYQFNSDDDVRLEYVEEFAIQTNQTFIEQHSNTIVSLGISRDGTHSVYLMLNGKPAEANSGIRLSGRSGEYIIVHNQ